MDSSKEQFSLIYDQYIEKIYRFVYVKVNSKEVAEDITSKVFSNGWEAYQKGGKINNIGAFLYQIARNKLIDHYKEKSKIKTVFQGNVPEIPDPKIDLHEKAVLSGDIEVVKAAMQNIRKDYQDVLIFHYLEDMTIPEIAKVLGKREGSVRVMLHRGLKSLKDQLIQEA